MKKVEILSASLVPGDKEGEMKTAHPGSVLQLDDAVAGALVAGQRARYAPPDAKLVDTTKRHEDAADKRAATAAAPEAAMAALIAAAVQAALAAQAPAQPAGQQPLA